MKRSHYVYRIDRPSTGEWYVGIRSCKGAPLADTSYLGSGTVLKRKIAAHPEEFTKTILVQVESREEAFRIEAALVGLEQLADPLCLNLCKGGDRGALGYHHSEEIRAKMRTAQKNRDPATAETRAKISATRMGHPVSDETRARMKAAQLARRERERESSELDPPRASPRHAQARDPNGHRT